MLRTFGILGTCGFVMAVSHAQALAQPIPAPVDPIQELERRLNGVDQRLSSELTKVGLEFSKVGDHMKELDKRISGVDSKVEDVNENVSKLTKLVLQVDDSLKGLKESVDESADKAEKRIAAVENGLGALGDRVVALEKSGAGGSGTTVLLAPHSGSSFRERLNKVLERQWREHEEREEDRKVACFLKGLLDEYGECCDPCRKTSTKSMSFLRPACYTTTVDPCYTSVVDECYTTSIIDPCITTTVSSSSFLSPTWYCVD